MKHVFYAIMLLGMMLTNASCSEEEFQAPATEQSAKGEKVTITVCLPEIEADSQNNGNQNHSRVAFDKDNLNITWQKGDLIRVEMYKENILDPDYTMLTLTSGDGTTRAQFTGNLPTGDYCYYKVYHGVTPWSFSLDPKSYGGQIQNGIDNTDHLNGYLVYNTGDKKLTLQEVLDGDFVLEPQSSVFCFTIASYPEKIGYLQQILWSSNYGDAQSGNLCLGLEHAPDPISQIPVPVYMAFDPATMKLNASKDIVLTLIGTAGTAVVKGHSEAGKEYLPGKRYTATVTTDTNEPNALNQWIEIPTLGNNQLLITTTDGQLPNSNFSNQKRIEGTNSFLIWNDDQAITALPDFDFYKKTNLLAVQLPAQLQEIGTSCFFGCSALASVTLPVSGSLKTIGESAFEKCNSLSCINFPEGLTTIKTKAFYSTNIGKAILPESLKSIEPGAFNSCQQLTTIHIPDQITKLPNNCFNSCNLLKTITGCSGVTSIQSGAFNNCGSLSSYPFTEKLTTIGSGVFTACKSLTDPLPLTVTTMGNVVFEDSGITEFTIHDNLAVVYEGNQPLWGAKQLTKLNITTAKDGATNFIPEEGVDNPQPGKIDLYILKDWASKTGNLKADVANKTWYDRTWKSITLIEKDGKPVVE